MQERLLSLDYGSKRIGLAVNDALGLAVHPLPYLENTSEKLKKLRRLIQERNIQKLILGLPVALSGEESIAAQKVRQFAAALAALGLPIEFIDERLSTAAAHKMMLQYNIPARERRQKVDSLAACILLEDYLRGQDVQKI
ncbi:MAG: Holliday junction resolvase RuvX [Candidatus Margulisbacteria bacterium]|jgi:putative Holliday junction resolvase|nr:Holliday junction resolvase RuvX [Candidatus Margulisiibacteriota bacterium]